MIAYQGFMTKSFKDLEFMQDNGLVAYHDENAPVVVYGGHYGDTINLIKKHKGDVIVNWTGGDSKRVKSVYPYTRPNITNVTTMPNIQKVLISKGINCRMIRHSRAKVPTPLVKGDKVYTYIHELAKAKYREDIVEEIKTPYDILIMRLSVPYKEWYAGKCDDYYGQSFIGLALSDFTGATGSAVDMGLRGIRVVTNVINMPHCIPWSTVSDIENAIAEEAVEIGVCNRQVSEEVASEMIIGAKGFDLDKLLVE